MIEDHPAANPYAPPQAAVDDVVPGEDAAVRIRQEHLLHEIRLKSIGTLYWLGALLLGLSAAGMLIKGGTFANTVALSVIVTLAFAAAFAQIGYGFRKLAPWVVRPGAFLAVIGLFAVPLGTIVNAYVLYLIFSKKGRTVLGKDYAAIMAATPTMKYRRSVGDWIALGVAGALLLSLVLLIAFG